MDNGIIHTRGVGPGFQQQIVCPYVFLVDGRGWGGQGGGMRQARMLVPPGMEGVYHVVSRVVDRRMVFGEEEKRHFLRLMKGYAGFSGLPVVSWCLMDNHFHLLVAVPEQTDRELPDKAVLGRMAPAYNGRQMKEFRAVYDACQTPQGRRALLLPYVRRMGDLGIVHEDVEAALHAVVQWKHGRTGTLWEGRFRSTIVEFESGLPVVAGSSREAAEVGDHAARIVAAYIDLNPVRAGIVEDPKDYAWSGYGAAVRGDKLAVKGIQALWGGRTKAEALAAHRLFVFEEGVGEETETQDTRRQDGRGEEVGKPRWWRPPPSPQPSPRKRGEGDQMLAQLLPRWNPSPQPFARPGVGCCRPAASVPRRRGKGEHRLVKEQ